jgi:putative membrane protein
MKPNQILITLAALGCFSFAAYAQNPATRPPGQQQPANPNQPAGQPAQPETTKTAAAAESPGAVTEEEFVKTALKSGNHEVMVANLAANKASDKKVKSLAQMLVKDHTAANKGLKAVASELKVTVEKEDPEGKAKYDALGAKTGAEFDTAFVEEMKAGHAKSIALFESAKGTAKTKSLVAFINKTLPVIKGHADKLDKLNAGPPAADKKPSGTDASQAPKPR